MNQYSTSFMALFAEFEALIEYAKRAQGHSKKISFFTRKRHKVESALFASSVVDIQRHAAALIGYFEGYEARAVFQSSYIVAENVDDTASCLALLEKVIQKTFPVIQRFASGDGVCVPNGPSKPGPQRTMEVACAHIKGLSIQLQLLVGVDKDT